MDRMDLQVVVPPVAAAALAAGSPGGITSAALRERVVAARAAQEGRGVLNAGLSLKALDLHAALDGDGEAYLRRASDRLRLSARAHVRVRRLARTIADLGGSAAVLHEHLAEAVNYRIRKEG